jgi:septum site-determining protein MinC
MGDRLPVNAAVVIKGTKDGLAIILGEGPLDDIVREMEASLASRASFFLGGRVALKVRERPLTVEQLQAIGAVIQRAGMSLWAVEGSHPTTHLAAGELGLETSLLVLGPVSRPCPPPSAEPLSHRDLPGIVVRRTLRAGQEVKYAGHVTIVGDVNPGAEVVAGGDLIVWGKLRGKVCAGALGDDTAIVCALQLAPSQIRIGSHIAQPPDRARTPKIPEMASVQEGTIVVERWDR